MIKQKKLIEEGEWGVLIILDACRYDYFKEVHGDYLNGELKRVRSGVIHTGEWLVKTFEDYYPDITYVSGMPHVNSLGLSLSDGHGMWEYGWKATDHFSKIIDVWDFGWSEKLGAAPPMVMNEAVVQTTDGNRKIVHYNQPHTPYLSLVEDSDLTRGKWNPRECEGESKGLSSKFRNWVGRRLINIFGREFVWSLREIMGMKIGLGNIQHAWRDNNVDYYYEDNLRRVLEAVSDLVDRLDGKIIITADHGECLGERGYWSHGYSGLRKIPRMPVLVEVPWFEVEK